MARILTFDMHTHLFEKKIEPVDYWKRVQKVGLDAVAITEHADCNPDLAYKALLELKPKNVFLIPGIEINSEYGHILAFSNSPAIYDVDELYEDGVKMNTLLQLSKEKNFLLCIPHPWGLSHDSFAYRLGYDGLEDLVMKKNVGVEVYNGIIGYLNEFLYESNWVKLPRNFVDFLYKNRVARKTGISKLSGKLKKKLDAKTMDVVIRCSNAIDLGEKAAFITAGSDAHSSDRVGTGVIKFRSEYDEITEENVLSIIKNKKNVVWSGPLVKESKDGSFVKVPDPLRKKEILQGVSYALRRVIKKKTTREKKKKPKEN